MAISVMLLESSIGLDPMDEVIVVFGGGGGGGGGGGMMARVLTDCR